MLSRPSLAALVLLFGGCVKPPPTVTAEAGPKPRVLTFLATSELRGTPEPCGCQSDPLGDVARIAALLKQARLQGGALLVDAGGLLYKSEPIKDAERPQAELKAKFLDGEWRELGAVMALGEEDLQGGLPPPGRLCSNATSVDGGPSLGLGEGVVRDVDGIKVGLFGLLDPARATDRIKVSSPIAAAAREVAALKQRGAQVIVALAHLNRVDARRLARSVPGLSIVVVGEVSSEDAGDGAEAELVGETILVQPAIEGQRVARVELHLVGDAISTHLIEGAEERARTLDRLRGKLFECDRELAALAKDPSADPTFVQAQRDHRLDLQRAAESLRAAPIAPPAGPWAIATLVPIRLVLPRDPVVAEAMKKLDAEAGELNRKAGEKVPVPPADPGDAHFTGDGDCELCHAKAVSWWKKTVHSKAWNTLVAVNKQWSFDCIKCHVTGYGQPGGSAMAHVDKLESVQCEACHGPGSLHVDDPKRARLRIPKESDCKQCHTKEHSDTFAFEPYLRDVLGPGHGEQRRAKLGDGPTGHELRGAAIAKASGAK